MIEVLFSLLYALNTPYRKHKRIEFDNNVESISNNRSNFVRSVVNRSKEEDAKKIIARGFSDSSIVERELKPLFDTIPELSGRESSWKLSSSIDKESNLILVELIVCLNHGCIPLRYVDEIRIRPWIYGCEYGVCMFTSLSDNSKRTLAKWIESKAKSIYGNSKLLYKSNSGKFVWDFNY